MSQSNVKPVALAVCTALGGLALSASAFASQPLASGYMASAGALAHGDKHAEGKCGEGKRHTLAMMDTDGDGRISRAEFAAAHDGKADKFGRYDANGDGFISAGELKAAHEGKCGEGKCGADKAKAGKKAGEGKCGEGKCGGAA
ncbi:MAG: EF-hand domain-containing protein [Pseudomonadota bacterium]|nr:EF-hand domain-containing protein [Pseudomonadota bacterium]